MQSALNEVTEMIMRGLMGHSKNGTLPSQDDYDSFEWLLDATANTKQTQAQSKGKIVPQGPEFNKQLENYKKHLKEFWDAGVAALSSSTKVSP